MEQEYYVYSRSEWLFVENVGLGMDKRVGMKMLNVMITAAVIFFTGGCGENISEKEKETVGMEDRTEMTASEMEFLKSIYIDEAQIDKGILYSYQKDALRQYRYAEQYLEAKYPSYELEITGGTPISKLNTYAVFYFHEQDNSYDYELHVYKEKDEAFAGMDNFYGSLIRQAYDQYVYEECADRIEGLRAVFSVITGVKDVSYDETLCVQDIIAGDRPISPATEIYLGGSEISEEEWEEAAALVEETIKKMGLYGSYTVCYLTDVSAKELTGEACHDCLKSRNYLYKYSFQNFER